MPISIVGKTRNREGGFTYLVVLAAVVVLGIVSEAAEVTAWRVVRSERETELMFRGLAYRNAIESYHRSNGRYPQQLEYLVRDPSAVHRRHLRALYTDPFSANAGGWMLIRAPDGGIMGVASMSKDEPLKRTGFPLGLEAFASAKSYQEWLFQFDATQSMGARGKPSLQP